MPGKNFKGLRVLTLESRRGREMSRLIETYGGRPVLAPAMREIPLDSNREALEFAAEFLDGKFDIVILLTGVGTRALAQVVQTVYPIGAFLDALRKVTVVARGPKPLAVLREWNVSANLVAPEPNTWREVIKVLVGSGKDLRGARIALQEYGKPSTELLAALRERGAEVKCVPVYQWALPQDTEPLREAVDSVTDGKIDLALFTTGVQITHLFQVAEELGKGNGLRRAFERIVVASIGPSTSETLRGYGISVDLEASHPKMGFLVKEAAERSEELVSKKRGRQIEGASAGSD